jgi:hypothetical protein
MRRSGMSQISAAATKIPSEIHGESKVATIAAIYSKSESLPFQSRPTALFKIESGPYERMIACWSNKYSMAAITSTRP